MGAFESFIERYGPQIEEELVSFLKLKANDVKDERRRRVIEEIARFTLSGGKRIRPSLMILGYAGSKGIIDSRIVKASISIELTHSYLLIHDDVMDRDEVRRNRPTVWRAFRDLHSEIYGHEDAAHYGYSMAIIAGDLSAVYAVQALLRSGFEYDVVLEAVEVLQDVIEKTGHGQILDMTLEKESLGMVKEKDVLEVHRLKTAIYTIDGPLRMGGVLARADRELLNAYSKYAIPVGIAFQLQDDILGVFGDEKVVGKPVDSDIKEGKKTLLVVKAWERATPEQRKILERTLGNRYASNEDVEMVREVIRSTGALDYVRKLALKLAEEGSSALDEADISYDVKKILKDLAKLVVERIK
ncbi:MAG: polyprenyl synthetase family protein [Candidatus Nezhaarchaeales archaeon]|nr:MAG: polyprenyl synthetase family protein [Candidatus Nezhaarchaeota archaeon WYZ-LMO8]TDA36611.1 MAG: polyprenyl synthetase family protein [Candidatus Nezhaarchaeota archaeon WYZ-LMO7]